MGLVDQSWPQWKFIAPRPPLIVTYSKPCLLCSLSAQHIKRMGSSAFMFPRAGAASFSTSYFIAKCLVNREAKEKRTKKGCYLTAANDYVSFFHTVNVCKAPHLRVSSFTKNFAFRRRTDSRLSREVRQARTSGHYLSLSFQISKHPCYRPPGQQKISRHASTAATTDPRLSERPSEDMVQGFPKCSMVYWSPHVEWKQQDQH